MDLLDFKNKPQCCEDQVYISTYRFHSSFAHTTNTLRDQLTAWIAENEHIPIDECNIPDDAEFMVARDMNNEIRAVCTTRHVIQVQMTFARNRSVFQSVASFKTLRNCFRNMGRPVWTLMNIASPLYDTGRRLMRRLPDTHELFFPLEKGDSNVHGD